MSPLNQGRIWKQPSDFVDVCFLGKGTVMRTEGLICSLSCVLSPNVFFLSFHSFMYFCTPSFLFCPLVPSASSEVNIFCSAGKKGNLWISLQLPSDSTSSCLLSSQSFNDHILKVMKQVALQLQAYLSWPSSSRCIMTTCWQCSPLLVSQVQQVLTLYPYHHLCASQFWHAHTCAHKKAKGCLTRFFSYFSSPCFCMYCATTS